MTAPHAAELPLSAGQRDIWFDEKVSGGGSAYNMGGYLDIRGALDLELFAVAAARLVDEAECMRVRFVEHDGVPAQVVDAVEELPLARLDFTSRTDALGAALGWMRRDISEPLAVGRFPLFRLALIEVGPDRAFFYMCIHHLLCDGFSQLIFWRRLTAIYDALRSGGSLDDGRLGPLKTLMYLAGAVRHLRFHARDEWPAVRWVALGSFLPSALTGLVLAAAVLLGFGEVRGDAPLPAFLLFLAVAMSITAVPVLIRILADRDELDAPASRLSLRAAIVIDAAGWLLLSVAVGLSAGSVSHFLRVMALFAAPHWTPSCPASASR